MADNIHRFTQEEVKDLVSRAAEIQLNGVDSSSTDTVSRLQLETACKEMGIDLSAVDQAINERESSPPLKERSSAILGGIFKVDVDQIVESSFASEDWPGLVAELNANFKQSRVNAHGLMEWTSRDMETRLLVAPMGKRTRIQVEAKNSIAALNAFAIPLALLSGFITANGFSVNWPVFWSIFVLTLAICRFATNKTGKKRRNEALAIAAVARKFIENQDRS